MYYIIRSVEPEHLKTNKVAWTQPWIDHYHKITDSTGKLKKEKKPSDSHWTNDLLRNVLINDFKNNCGYCGCSRPTPKSATDKKRAPRGHVDHYRAKAIYPELTYEWTNYIWSCESCNVEKGEFDNPKYPLLNPCNKTDCDLLIYIIDTGIYSLNTNNNINIERFKNTDKMTMINATEITVKRRNRVKRLISSFDSICGFIQFPQMENYVKNCILDIINELEDQEFFFLIEEKYLDLRVQKPIVAELIDTYKASAPS